MGSGESKALMKFTGWAAGAAAATIAALVCSSSLLIEAQQKELRESGEFKIHSEQNEIGTEKYVILGSGGLVTSSSTLDFRNPGETHQKIRLETRLEMNSRFVPKNYLLKSDVEGKKGTIAGEFSPNQAMFSYSAGEGTPRKSGLLVGNDFTLLDTNIFHHFIFLARNFKYGQNKPQRFEVVIPQEQDSGFLSIAEVGKETLIVRGKKIETHHLQVDSGSIQIHLWVDNQRIVHKITVPGRRIEVFRNP
jgi:hypothetical protein